MLCPRSAARTQRLVRGILLPRIVSLLIESINRPTDTLQREDDVSDRYSFPLCVFTISYTIFENLCKMLLQRTSGVLVNRRRNPLHASSSRQPSDCRLRDTLYVVAQQLSRSLEVGLSTANSQPKSSRSRSSSNRAADNAFSAQRRAASSCWRRCVNWHSRKWRAVLMSLMLWKTEGSYGVERCSLC